MVTHVDLFFPKKSLILIMGPQVLEKFLIWSICHKILENSLLLSKVGWWNELESWCHIYFVMQAAGQNSCFANFLPKCKNKFSKTVRCGVMKVSEQQVATYMWYIFGSSALWSLGIKHDRVCIVGVKLLRVLSHHAGQSRGHSPSYHPMPRQHPNVRFDPGKVLENSLVFIHQNM